MSRIRPTIGMSKRLRFFKRKLKFCKPHQIQHIVLDAIATDMSLSNILDILQYKLVNQGYEEGITTICNNITVSIYLHALCIGDLAVLSRPSASFYDLAAYQAALQIHQVLIEDPVHLGAVLTDDLLYALINIIWGVEIPFGGR